MLGIYYLTVAHKGEPGERPAGKELAFTDIHEALLAYTRKHIGMHTLIKVRVDRKDSVESDSKPEAPIPANRVVTTTMGRLIFNDILPVGMPFYNLGFRPRAAAA